MFSHRFLTLLTGFLFFGGMLMIGYFTIARQKEQGLRSPEFYLLELETAEGLKVGASVQILGVPSGVVDSMYYVPPEDSGETKVLAVLAISRQVPIYSNYRIITRFPTALAAKVVEINPGTRTNGAFQVQPRLLGSHELVNLKTSGVMPEAGANVLRAANYDDPLYLIATSLTENRRSLRKIASNVAEITEKMNSGNGTIAALLNRGDLVNNTNEILRGSLILIQEIREGVEDTRESRAAIDFISVVTAFVGLK